MALILPEFRASSEVVKVIQVTQLGLLLLFLLSFTEREVAPSRIGYLPLDTLLILFIYEKTNLIHLRFLLAFVELLMSAIYEGPDSKQIRQVFFHFVFGLLYM